MAPGLIPARFPAPLLLMNPPPPSSSANLASSYRRPHSPSLTLNLLPPSPTPNLPLCRSRPRSRHLVASSSWSLNLTPGSRSVHCRAVPRAGRFGLETLLWLCRQPAGRSGHFHRFDRTQFHSSQSPVAPLLFLFIFFFAGSCLDLACFALPAGQSPEQEHRARRART